MTALQPPEDRDDVVALLTAAGSGSRLGLGPKALLRIEGRTLVRIVAETLAGCARRVLVGVPAQLENTVRAEVAGIAEVFPGGETRQDTLRLLLEHADAAIVVVHDVTRPFASRALVTSVIKAAREHGAAGAFVPLPIPVALCSEGLVSGHLRREKVLLPQSPQAYRREILQAAYRHAEAEGIREQTTWQLVLQAGHRLHPVPGEDLNIKITAPFDWDVARLVVASARQSCKEEAHEFREP